MRGYEYKVRVNNLFEGEEETVCPLCTVKEGVRKEVRKRMKSEWVEKRKKKMTHLSTQLVDLRINENAEWESERRNAIEERRRRGRREIERSAMNWLERASQLMRRRDERSRKCSKYRARERVKWASVWTGFMGSIFCNLLSSCTLVMYWVCVNVL